MTSAAAGISGLASRYGLPAQAVSRLEELLRLLSTDPLAPTSVRDPQRVLDDHLADSLVALELDVVRSAGVVLDIGSGAGLPGLPLAVAMPAARFVLLESVTRKCQFLERLVAACGLSNVEVVHDRAEAWTGGLERFELVVIRAVAALDVVLEYGAPMLGVGGRLLVWRGRRDREAEAAASRAAEVLGMQVVEVREVQPYPEAHDRYLHLFSKVRETPDEFPRRPGVAAKRPLGRV
ncbi:MAG: 16S rRNA (guanine(527)-N(7))-methyltransferase RsmG [Solirubrobacteraceae bacterium]